MNELTAMRDFGAERVEADPEARAAAFQALSARIEAEEAAGRLLAATVTGTEVPPLTAKPRRRLLPRRRPALAFAGVTALAALVVGVLVLGAGSTTQPASAAEVLRRTAAIAADTAPPTPAAGPRQLLYSKTEQAELQQWNKGFTASYGGVTTTDPEPIYGGQVRWTEEAWMSNHRKGRDRLVLDSVSFLTAAERKRWKAAGSPLPGLFGGELKDLGPAHPLEIRRGVYDVEGLNGPGYGHFADLPTEPAALRRAIERKIAGGGPLEGHTTPTGELIGELWEILDKANSSAALRAAVFGALAEVPGIDLDRHATDMAGRHGDALTYEGRRAGAYPYPGVKVEYIFDPDTAAVLGKRETIGDTALARTDETQPIPHGTVIRDTAYLGYGVVGSTHQRPSSARATGS
jgi:hypothetical protein